MVARDKARLDQVGEKIRQTAGNHVEVIAADLSNASDLHRVCQRLEVDPAAGKQTAVSLLVNNAGFGLNQPFLEAPLPAVQAALDVMVTAVMQTCHSAGRSMRARGVGAIINVSSVAADTGMGPYSAHKSWVRAFSEGLAEELRGSGVSVTAVMPGLTRTEFHARAAGTAGVENHPAESSPGFTWLTATQVVEETLRAVDRRQVLVTPSLRYKVAYHAARLLPRTAVRAVMRSMPHT